MEQLNKYFIDLHGRKFVISRTSRSRMIQLVVDNATLFEPKIKYRLTAIDHEVHVDLSRRSWNSVMANKHRILLSLQKETRPGRSTADIQIETNEEDLKIFTKDLHNKRAICFKNYNKEVRIMLGTFEHLVLTDFDLEQEYRKLRTKLEERAKEVLKMLILTKGDPRFYGREQFLAELEGKFNFLLR